MTSVSVGVEPYFGAFILETLTVGMYGSLEMPFANTSRMASIRYSAQSMT